MAGITDFEFDLIAEDSPKPRVHPKADFKTRKSDINSTQEEIVAVDMLCDEMEDSRISSLVEMGFSREEALEALSARSNDINEALSYLLSRRD